MGGYGAFKWALRQPERFAAAASLSGALNMAQRSNTMQDYRLIFGDEGMEGTEDDLMWLLGQRDTESDSKPKLYQCCGTEDFFYMRKMWFSATPARGQALSSLMTKDREPTIGLIGTAKSRMYSHGCR